MGKRAYIDCCLPADSSNPFQGFAGGNPFPNPFPPTKIAAFNQNGTYVNLPLGLHHPYMQQ